jgi:hypothetical protein
MNRIDTIPQSGSKQKMVPVTVGGLLLATTCMVVFLFGTGVSAAQVSPSPNSYVGIWKMTVHGKRVGTLELMNYNGRLVGSITNGHASMDGNGNLIAFDAIPGAAPIVQASISQGMLVIGTEEINEAIVTWNMTLNGEGKGLLQLAVKGHEMTFQLSRISWSENEEDSETATK